MITEVKMQVTPDLSKRVQEIVFSNGGCWSGIDLSTKVYDVDNIQYLFIDRNKMMAIIKDSYALNIISFKEISAYDFIASNGEQEWLPKYNEQALFSDDEKSWKKVKFLLYYTSSSYPFRTNSSTFRYCKPLPKEVSFIQFLKDNNAYEVYMENVKVENQRWKKEHNYKELADLQKEVEEYWVTKAFNFSKQLQPLDYWQNINNKWVTICRDNEVVWGE